MEHFPGFTTLQLCHKVQEFMSKMSDQREEFNGRIILMSMLNDISRGSEHNEQECESNVNLVSIYARRLSPGRWSFLGPGSEKKCYSTHDSRPQGEWDRVAESMMIRLRERGHPVFRVPSPLSRQTLESKGGGKLSIHFCADGGTIETFFHTIMSVKSAHQISTLEKTNSWQHSTLANLMSKRLKQVSLFFDAAQSTSSERS